MTQRHKHIDVIIAWANGAEIQWRDSSTEDWMNISFPSWHKDYEYRVKPPARKYRVALFKDGTESYTLTADNQETSNGYEVAYTFVRWLTDWVEYEG